MSPRSILSGISRVVWLILACCWVAPVAAQGELSISTSVQPQRGITDARPFQFVIAIGGTVSPNVRPDPFPSIEGLQLLSGPMVRQETSIRNGVARSSVQLVYQLLAGGPGSYTIPSLDVEVDGVPYRTEPVSVQVGDGGGTPGATQAEGPDIFLEAKLGSKEIWVGQTVPLTVTLFTTVQVTDLSWRNQPAYSDFWVEKSPVDPESDAYRTTIDGRAYLAYPLQRRVLIPPGAGSFSIDPYVLQMQVRTRGGDPFDLFSFGQRQTVVRQSRPMTLVVKPLPAEPPAGFSGAVGRFRLEVAVDREEVRVNDAVSLKVTLDGEGSLLSVPAPGLELPPEIKVFDPEVRQSSRSPGGKLDSRKSWEWLLVPLTAGEVRIPPVRFVQFDPVAGRYRVLEGEETVLKVERGDGADVSGPLQGEVRVQRRDLEFIKMSPEPLRRSAPRAHQRPAFLVASLLPLALLPVIIGVGRRSARLRQDRGLARSRRARRRARKSLKTIRGSMAQLDAAQFHEEVGRTLVEFVADRFNRSASGLNYEQTDELLAGREVDPALRRRFRRCLESCDFARFVPEAGSAERRQELLDEARAVLEELDRAC